MCILGTLVMKRTKGSVSRRHLAYYPPFYETPRLVSNAKKSSLVFYFMNTAFYWKRQASKYRTDKIVTRFSTETNYYDRD